MSYLPQFLTLASVFLLGAMSPGPDFVAVTSHALISRRAGFHVALGIAAAIMVWAALAMFGLGLVLTQIAWAHLAVRIAGAVYLGYLGSKILLSAWQAQPPLAVSGAETTAPWRSGFVVGITNPKTAAFFASLFISVLPMQAPIWVQAVSLAIIGLVAMAWFGLVALMFSTRRVRSVYGSVRRPIDALLGVALIALSARIAVTH
ncbi:LysE family transporter [Mesorhizobium sp. M1060]|uniref:LysE family translocator n=1 Tax=unclassified Mesorhizobium TaxID=325217 RepID=UPI0003CE0864|nr:MULTISPECIES: LysE family transporter [unclassified Mesorhizobium]ESX61604.1 lysine transporter LysE [Mesorhizobium sp. LSHC422A00]ESZ05102.1 lysine transporter LysE [Mesorhizobium sp. L2C089B000]ESZ74821.1 lysine transporter LysE [Mesorhizobium sp. L103C105A0]WJI49498.1 LysE family transporter [Mesorhizobium sp. C089B]